MGMSEYTKVSGVYLFNIIIDIHLNKSFHIVDVSPSKDMVLYSEFVWVFEAAQQALFWRFRIVIWLSCWQLRLLLFSAGILKPNLEKDNIF